MRKLAKNLIALALSYKDSYMQAARALDSYLAGLSNLFS